jgi:plasmid stabilization system protein ParE
MTQYLLTPRALQDMESIADYLIVEAGPAIADAVIDNLNEEIVKAAANPRLGRVRTEWMGARHRFWSARPYYIVYREDGRPIRIIRVLHMSRDIPAALSAD